jgi:hypothetical protein
MNYAEIEAECAEIVATSRRVLNPHTRAVFAAFIQHANGLEVVERCHYCRGPLAVIENGSALVVSCPCGLSHASRNIMKPRRHLTLIDLMAAVGAAALALGWVVWAAPGRVAPALSVIGPLVGILWDRWRGCRGILGGALGGAAYAGVGLIWLVAGPNGPGRLAHPLEVVIMIAFCLIFGTLMGVAAWLVAAMMGRSVAPASPSPNNRFARQR